MKTLMKKIEKRKKRFLFNLGNYFLVFVIFCTTTVLAQDVKNIENSLSSIKEEQIALNKAKLEELAFQQRMSYVYMGVAFIAVMGIAWLLTLYFGKKHKKAIEVVIQQRQEIKPLERSSKSKRYGHRRAKR